MLKKKISPSRADGSVSRAFVRPEGPQQRGGSGPGSAPLAIHEIGFRPIGKPKNEGLTKERATRRDRRYELRDTLADVTKIRRVKWCGRLPARGKHGAGQQPGIAVQDCVAHFVGVGRCGSVWACTVCAPKIRQMRAAEIAKAIEQWEAVGNTVLFGTYTAPHDAWDTLAELTGDIDYAYRRVRGGRKAKSENDKYGVEHTVKTWDHTHGGNGWHPHLTNAVFVRGKLTPEEVKDIEAAHLERWNSGLEKKGRRVASKEHGVRIETTETPGALARYLTKAEDAGGFSSSEKFAMELTRGDLKKGKGSRNPFQILADFDETGDMRDLALWHEWERATKGKNFAVWSKGAREYFKLDEKTDEELAEEEVGGEVIYHFSRDEWTAISRTRGAPGKALRVAEAEGATGIKRYAEQVRRDYETRRKRAAA